MGHRREGRVQDQRNPAVLEEAAVIHVEVAFRRHALGQQDGVPPARRAGTWPICPRPA